MQDAVVNLIRVSLREHQRTGVPAAHRQSARHDRAGHDLPPARRAVPTTRSIIYAQPQMWPAVCKVLGRPELAEDPRFKTRGSDRWENRAALERDRRRSGPASAPSTRS